MMTRARFTLCLTALGIAAMAIRGWHCWSFRDTEYWGVLLGDAARYHEWAQEIAGGAWIGEGTFYQAPLYPYVLAALYSTTGPSVAAARTLHCLLGAASCVLLANAGRRFFGPVAGLLAGFFLAISPAAVFHDGLLQKTSLATFLSCLLLAMVAGLLRRPSLTRWFFAGLIVGLLGLVRENALLLGGVLAAWGIWFPRPTHARNLAARRCLMLLCGVMAALAPVLVRNRLVGGEWRLTTAQFGPNFYIGNNRDADGTYYEFAPERGTPTFEQLDATEIAESRSGRKLRPGEVSAWWTRRTWTDIREAPREWLGLLAQKAALTWSTVEIADTEDQFTYAALSPPLWILSRWLPFGILSGVAWFGIAATWRARRRLWVLYAMLAAYTASVALFYVFARYRLPLVPTLALFAGAGTVRLSWMLRHREWRRLILCGAVGAAVWLFAQPDIVGRMFPRWPDLAPSRMRSVTCFNMGAAHWRNGSPLEEVEPWFKQSVALNPEYASAWLFWGRVLADFDQPTQAVPKLRRAAELDPRGSDIRVDLGEALLDAGQPREAIAPLEQAVALEPSLVDAQHLLGRALVIAGRQEEALPRLQEAVRLDPEFVLARRLLAITLDRTGRREEAREQFRKLYELLPPGSPEREMIGRVLGRRVSPLSKRNPAVEETP
jgi:tetratricopeptide (TPR) repeat protein